MTTRRNPLLNARWNQLASEAETAVAQVHPRTLSAEEMVNRDPAYFDLFPEQLDQIQAIYQRTQEDRVYLEHWRLRLDHIMGTYRTLYGSRLGDGQGGISFDLTFQRLERAYWRLEQELNLMEEVIEQMELFPSVILTPME